MLNITGLNRFSFVRDFHDMRCKYDKVLSIIHQQIHEGYFPFSGHPAIIDVVPGTHASGSFPAYLAFNKYVLDTPLYREMYRLSGESMHLSRMSLTNWLEKGSTYFCGLIAYLMNTFWTQLFAYLNDGSYSTDNSIAERFIRPLAGERKNSLFFGSDKMAGSQRYIIPSSPLAGCRVCLCLIISRDFSVKLLKDVWIMNIYYP